MAPLLKGRSFLSNLLRIGGKWHGRKRLSADGERLTKRLWKGGVRHSRPKWGQPYRSERGIHGIDGGQRKRQEHPFEYRCDDG